jgi:hypothetical protein
MSVDFNVKITNHVNEFEKLQEAPEKKTQTSNTEVVKRRKNNYSNR